VTDWQPGDPLYDKPHIRWPMVDFRDFPTDQLGIDAATWPIPHPADDIEAVAW
jgi:hypothetical protein